MVDRKPAQLIAWDHDDRNAFERAYPCGIHLFEHPAAALGARQDGLVAGLCLEELLRDLERSGIVAESNAIVHLDLAHRSFDDLDDRVRGGSGFWGRSVPGLHG